MDEAGGGEAGGISGLVALLTEHGDAVEADLQAEYGVDLADLLNLKTWRRLLVLLLQLPPTSRLARVLHGEQWSLSEHLLASTVDALNLANWQRTDAKRARPKPIKRPGVEDDTVVWGRGNQMSFDAARSWLAQWRPTDEGATDGG